MKRTIAMLGAALVLLLLASGFMAADNIRLSGEKAALTDKFNDQSYEYSLLYHQLQTAKQQVGELTRERDELQLELQDYQPGTETGEAVPSADDLERAADDGLPGEDAVAEEEATQADEAVSPEAFAEAAASEKAQDADSAHKTPAEKNLFIADDETADDTEKAADLALPLVPAVENAMADAAPAAETEPDTALQLEQLRQEVQALSRQVDMLRAQLFASRIAETGVGYVFSFPAPALTPAPSADPLLHMDNMFRNLPQIPDIRQWADALEGE